MTPQDEGTPLVAPKSSALQLLYWRSEILQVMYWLRGEGFGDLVDAPLVERFLGVDASIGVTYLDRLVEEGYPHRRRRLVRLVGVRSRGRGRGSLPSRSAT